MHKFLLKIKGLRSLLRSFTIYYAPVITFVKQTDDKLMQGEKNWILPKKILFNAKAATVIWFLAAVIAVGLNLIHTNGKGSEINNFVIFRTSYYHIINNANLYSFYPAEYNDIFIYGPSFTAFITPFALMPLNIGVFCWVIFSAWLLYFAITKLPVKKELQYAIMILSSNELLNTSSHSQFNAIVCACIILSYCYTRENKLFWATAFIAFSTLTKIYGAIGFLFFFFTKDKMKFVLYSLFWFIVIGLSPVIITSFSFLWQCYTDWYNALIIKSARNLNYQHVVQVASFVDISVMGFIKRIFGIDKRFDKIIVVSGTIMTLAQFAFIKYFSNVKYQLYILCSLLLYIIIFSNGAESPTYIIPFIACSIWYAIQDKTTFSNTIFIICLLFTSFSNSDIFTPWVREHIVTKYAVKAIPCFILWLIILVQVYKKQFLKLSKEKFL